MELTLAERIERRNKQLKIVNILSFPDLTSTLLSVSFMQQFGHEIRSSLHVIDPKGNRFTLEFKWRDPYYAFIKDGLFWLRRFYKIEGEAWFCLNYISAGSFTMKVYDQKGKQITYSDFSIRVDSPDPAPMDEPEPLPNTMYPDFTLSSVYDNLLSDLKDTVCSLVAKRA